jgi:D-lactate dehydrogenase (cytochrome)
VAQRDDRFFRKQRKLMNDIGKIRKRIVKNDDIYLCDESRMPGGSAKEVYFPENISEISTLASYFYSNEIPYTVFGRGTGITGASVPFGGVVVSLEKLNKINNMSFCENAGKYFLNLEPGVILADIRDSLKDYFYPVDPTEMSASIGGTVATNASGACSFKYGPTRNWIKSLKTVLPDGSILHIERGKHFADRDGFINVSGKKMKIPEYKMPECKNAAGLYSAKEMDLIDLFIGSEGLIGIVAEIEVWLEKKYPATSFIAFFDDEKRAVEFVEVLRIGEILPEFIEYVDSYGLDMLKKRSFDDPASLNIPPLPESSKAGVFFDMVYQEEGVVKVVEVVGKMLNKASGSVGSFCAWENIEKERIKFFRHALPETVNSLISETKRIYPDIHKLGTDIAVPHCMFGKMNEFSKETLLESRLKFVSFGHIGDSHIHFNIIPENYDEMEKGKRIYGMLAQKAVELGGTVSAEHGIGKLKHKYLEIMYGKKGINEMRRVKKFFDPLFLLNRGNMFDPGDKN